MASGIARSIVFVAFFVVAVWAIGALLGYEISLVTTLVASIALTLVANLLFGGFRRLTS